MHYDEETGDMIGDDYSYASKPYRSGYSSCSVGRRPSAWREKQSSIFNYMAFAAACFLIGGFIGKYRPQDKIEEWWRSFSSNHISREESGVKGDAASSQEVRFTVICWHCNAELDASHLKHLASFDGECPYCNAQFHFERRK